MPDSIVRSIELNAPIERVWHAITDHREFGRWFRVALDGPFAVGEPSTGQVTHAGFEHVRWRVQIVAIEPMERFAFTWHPYAVDPEKDYDGEPSTLVEFLLEPRDCGTRLTVVESGFDRIPADRREEAMRMNEGGWTQQMDNIRAHVGG